jgi:hypothetical protein
VEQLEQNLARSAAGWLLLGSWLMLVGCAEVLDIPTEPRLVRGGMKEGAGMWSHSGRAGKPWAPEAESDAALEPVQTAAPRVVPVRDAAADQGAVDLGAVDLGAVDLGAVDLGAVDLNAAEDAPDPTRPPEAGSGTLGGQELFIDFDAGPDAFLSHAYEPARSQRADDGNRAGAARQ